LNLAHEIAQAERRLAELQHQLSVQREPIPPEQLRQFLEELDKANRNLSDRLIKLEKFAQLLDAESAIACGIVVEIPF